MNTQWALCEQTTDLQGPRQVEEKPALGKKWLTCSMSDDTRHQGRPDITHVGERV